ncbi:MAG: DUF2218 domain-containing protein [Streptosporangiaceae bacterium]
MLTAIARIPTPDPGRYLVRLCQHASQMGAPLRHRPRAHAGGGAPPEMRAVEWNDTDGSLTLDWGRCILHAAACVLELRAEAADEEGLARVQELIARRLEKLGHRDRLTVTWHRQPQ